MERNIVLLLAISSVEQSISQVPSKRQQTLPSILYCLLNVAF